jgi:hypothetical protein
VFSATKKTKSKKPIEAVMNALQEFVSNVIAPDHTQVKAFNVSIVSWKAKSTQHRSKTNGSDNTTLHKSEKAKEIRIYTSI